MYKKIICLMCMVTMLFSSVTVFAMPTDVNGVMFDAEYYAQNNPDVVAVFGNNPDLLYQHYVTVGMQEGRLGVAPNDNIQTPVAVQSPTFLIVDSAPISTKGMGWYPASTTDYSRNLRVAPTLASVYRSAVMQAITPNVVGKNTYTIQEPAIERIVGVGLINAIVGDESLVDNFQITKIERNSPTQYTFHTLTQRNGCEDDVRMLVVNFNQDMTIKELNSP